MASESKTILLVDDSPVIQTLLKKIFFGLGINVIGLKTGAKVIETIETKEVDVVIMDIILPDSDGLELIQEIRNLKDSKKSQLPVVGISGNYKKYDEKDFARLGVSKIHIKPLDYDAVVASVNSYL